MKYLLKGMKNYLIHNLSFFTFTFIELTGLVKLLNEN